MTRSELRSNACYHGYRISAAALEDSMLLRHLVTHFLQQQAKAKFAQAMQPGASATAKAPPRATPIPVDGLLLYPTELEAGGVLDLTGEKQTVYNEAFAEITGAFGTRRVALVEVGDGTDANKKTAMAMQWIQPLWVVSLGFASGLAKDVRRGQIVMANVVCNESGDTRRVGLALSEGQEPKPGLHQGKLLSLQRMPRTTAERRALAASGAVAFDGDSYFVAQSISGAVTLISVRIVSEGIDDELPKAVKAVREQKTLAGKLGAAAGALLDSPGSLATMWKLRDEAIGLSDRLAKFLEGVVEQLPRRAASSGAETT
jgi:adenosylhomocysteine nucleosidase